jgi:hypothetical protein
MRPKACLAARVSLRLARLCSTLVAAPGLLAHALVTKQYNLNERSPYNAYTACRARLHVTNVLVKTQCIHEKGHVIVIIVR